MGHLIVANRRGHQVLEWPDTDTEEARQQIALAELGFFWGKSLRYSQGRHAFRIR